MKLQNKLYILILIGIFVFFPNFVNADDCGGSIQCQCGDTLVESQVMWYDLNNCTSNGLVINNENINLNCNNYMIDGNAFLGSSKGIYLNNTNNVVIQNCNIRDFGYGISLNSSSDNTLFNNNLNTNGGGIRLYYSSNNNLSNNIINNLYQGIDLYYSTYNTLSNNNVNNNSIMGIILYPDSDNNILFYNTVNNNKYGIILSLNTNNYVSNNNVKENSHFDIDVDAESDSHCNHIIENNNVSGDYPFGYFNYAVNLENEIFSELILCNADNSNINNVTITGSNNLKNNGIIVERTDYSSFTNINSSNNYYGILLDSSSYNTISNSNLNYNNNSGVSLSGYLTGSSNNQILNNNIKENSWLDMWIYAYLESDCNNIIENNIGSGNREIKYFNSATNFEDETVSELILCNADNSNIQNVDVIGSDTLQNNMVIITRTDNSNFTDINSSNNNNGFNVYSSSYNTFSNNILNNNKDRGISLSSYSNSNIFLNNIANDNNYAGISLYLDFNNTLKSNIVNNNSNHGIVLYHSSNNNIIDNNIKNNNDGIYLGGNSSNNILTSNIANNNNVGIFLTGFPNNWVSNNKLSNNEIIENNQYGIDLSYARNNTLWGNVFIGNNVNSIEYTNAINNNWNTTIGNYWSDFENNPGYPNYYEIYGPGDGIDYYPNFVEYYIDNSDEEFYTLFGSWSSRHINNAYNNEAMYNEAGFGDEMVAWKVNDLVYPGTYKVYVWKFEHNYSSLMGTNVHYMVYHRLGTSNWILVNQQTLGNEWVYLGEFEFDNSHRQGVMITNEANGYVVADAIKLVYQGPLSNLDSSGPDLFDMKE